MCDCRLRLLHSRLGSQVESALNVPSGQISHCPKWHVLVSQMNQTCMALNGPILTSHGYNMKSILKAIAPDELTGGAVPILPGNSRSSMRGNCTQSPQNVQKNPQKGIATARRVPTSTGGQSMCRSSCTLWHAAEFCPLNRTGTVDSCSSHHNPPSY